MNKLVLISTLAAVALTSGIAGAVTLKNESKDVAIIGVDMNGKKETVEVMSGGTFDTKGKDVGLMIGSNKPIAAKGEEKYVVKGGKIEAAPAEAATGTAAAKTPATPGTPSAAGQHPIVSPTAR